MKEIICDNLVFPECMRWRDGTLWFVDMYDGRLMSVVPGNQVETLLNLDTVLGGIGWLPGGKLIFCDKSNRKLVARDGSVHADLSAYHPAPVNDLITLPDGTAYVGEYGFHAARGEPFAKGNLYLINPDGTHRIAADKLSFPNGMALGLDQRTLYVAESYARRISVFDILEDGELSGPRTFIRFDEGGPDGISIDPYGNIWVSLVGPKVIVRITPNGETDRTIAFDHQPYDVEVGTSADTLFVAVSGAQFEDLSDPPLPRLGQILRIKI